jgi:hypothetical protein
LEAKKRKKYRIQNPMLRCVVCGAPLSVDKAEDFFTVYYCSFSKIDGSNDPWHYEKSVTRVRSAEKAVF